MDQLSWGGSPVYDEVSFHHSLHKARRWTVSHSYVRTPLVAQKMQDQYLQDDRIIFAPVIMLR